MFRIKIICNTHGETVRPASEQLHFIPVGNKTSRQMDGWHELDFADTWCPTVNDQEHEYSVVVEFSNE